MSSHSALGTMEGESVLEGSSRSPGLLKQAAPSQVVSKQLSRQRTLLTPMKIIDSNAAGDTGRTSPSGVNPHNHKSQVSIDQTITNRLDQSTELNSEHKQFLTRSKETSSQVRIDRMLIQSTLSVDNLNTEPTNSTDDREPLFALGQQALS